MNPARTKLWTELIATMVGLMGVLGPHSVAAASSKKLSYNRDIQLILA
jgi:hypothetical protein